MKNTRTKYPQSKVQSIAKIAELAKNYNIIAVSNLHKVRASQIMSLRKNFRTELQVYVAKNKLAIMSLKKTGLKNIESFIKNLKGQNALIMTNINPFKLYLMLEKSKVNLPARSGDIATDPIMISSGNTGIQPGPVLSDFKESKVPTRIDTGSIWVAKDTIVRQKGEKISPKLAGLLARLDIKPIRAGISILAAYSDGLAFREEDIQIDLNEYQSSIPQSFQEAMALAIGSSYFTKETITPILVKANIEGLALAFSAEYLTNETASKIVTDNLLVAESVMAALRKKG